MNFKKSIGRRLLAGWYRVLDALNIMPDPGSPEWLVRAEYRYGGYVSGIARSTTSPHDLRSAAELQTGGMRGGDRMSGLYHGYAGMYAKYLQPMAHRREPITLVEIGILRGSGLATWSELFPAGRIIGLDIDLGNVRDNMDFLLSRGAFASNNLELHEFDQLVDNRALLGTILDGSRIDVLIDDGLHSAESILMTLASVRPYLAPEFLYIVEDHPTIHEELAASEPGWSMDHQGELTVLFPKQRAAASQ